MIALLFASPDWNEMVTAVYLLILLVIYEGANTLLGVSFMAFTVNTFLSTNERTEVQVIASYVNQIPVFLGGMIPVWFLTGEYSRETVIAIFSGAFLLGLLLIWIGSQFIRLIVSDFGPTLTALMLATRVGAGIAAEIGSMKVTEQIDALPMSGVLPVDYLLVPRFLASVVMMVVLAILGAAITYGTGDLTAYLSVSSSRPSTVPPGMTRPGAETR